MKLSRLILWTAVATLQAACASVDTSTGSGSGPNMTAGAAAPQQAANDQAPQGAEAAAREFRAVLEASDAAMLARRPLDALFRGDLTRAGQFGDYLSDGWIEAERRAAAADLARLRTIDRDLLGAVDRLAYDAFVWNRQDALLAHGPEFAAIWSRLPIDHYGGVQLMFAALSSGEGAAPYRTVADYDNGLSRIAGFVAYLDQSIDRMRQGMKLGIVLPRVIAERTLAQFGTYAAQTLAQSQYYEPIRKLPVDFSQADRERLVRAYTAAIEGQLRPAFERVARFLRNEYLAAARDSVGLAGLPGGASYYAQLARHHTTTAKTPQQIHTLGLAEVARLTGELRKLADRTGHTGPLDEFFRQVRQDPRFKPASARALQDGYADIARRVDLSLPRLFSHRPKTPLEIRPIPEVEAKGAAGAYYMPGSMETGRPGIFFFNSHDLPSRTTTDMETLYLHEAVPGHHYQGSLVAEDPSLPKILRYEWVTSYGEGWALYAESLGPELGLYTDPYQLFGHLQDQMLRAMRLVVDTGLHSLGWTRERAIDYMLAHSDMSRTEVTSEVERYIVDPGQALAYKIGEITIRQLRTRAERTLGSRFDIREFHDQVLSTGALPLDVLTAKIDGWISSRSSAQGSAQGSANR